ncbi:MAG: hypothetical protein CO140_00580 [Candidatus Moranbacteria bacterium CG_4_9_14_3_um_filter_40_7]|nr:MAG: hypothetical protein COS71_04050 [Candidatus Moranbacteria bacterium CG06_land_8_20_14_3_00_40_12]PJA88120.1 MAG: hypothetical protein CO140_00580 [Candidatus Moranbacteria bacterium CG_4_9_14_3_um_filter_40_7]
MGKKKINTKLAVSIIIILTITAGIFVWKYETKRLEPAQQIQITGAIQQKNQIQEHTISNAPTEVGSQNQSMRIDTWKIYTNNKDGYSIKYPSGWISNFIDGSSFYVKELQKSGEQYPSSGNVLSDNLENLKNINGDYFINISVYKKMGTHVNLKEWRKYDGTDYQNVLIQGYPALKFVDTPHKSYDGKNKDMAGSLRYYFIDKKNNGFEISIWYKDTSNGIGDRIVSTLSLAN